MRTKPPLSAIVIVLIGCSSSLRAEAATLVVPRSYRTIQLALDAASDGDTVLIAPGQYFEALDLLGKAVRLRTLSGPSATVVDAMGTGRVMSGLDDGAIIEGLTLRGGSAGQGGAMYNDGTSPTVRDCVFEANTATQGGAIYNRNGASPTLFRCTFVDNVAGFGGAIYCRDGSSVLMSRCMLVRNTATTGTGGAMFVMNSHPTILDSVFEENESLDRSGGAIVCFGSDPAIIACAFRANMAADDGGAMHNDASDPIIAGSHFDGNDAGFGGAISNESSDPRVTNTLFTANTASWGAAAFSVDSAMSLTNCTFIDNVAGADGGALRNIDSGVVVFNSIVRANQPSQISDFQGASRVERCNIEGGWSGPGGANLDVEAAFVNATIGNYRLLPGSACIDAGDDGLLPADELDLDQNGDANEPLPVDLDEAPRVVGAAVDLGAYEQQDLETCPADMNGDGTVDFRDILALLAAWGDCPGCPHDLDASGFIDGFDLYYMVLSWGDCGD